MTTNVTPLITNRRFAIGCLALAVIFFCCALATLAGVILYRIATPAGAPPYVPAPPAATQAPVAGAPPYVATPADAGAPANLPAVSTADGEFIAGQSKTVNGPAIVQLWDGKTVPGCGIFKIPAGYHLTWALRGHWWVFEGVSENAFNAEFDRSAAAYAASDPQCTMALPEGALK